MRLQLTHPRNLPPEICGQEFGQNVIREVRVTSTISKPGEHWTPAVGWRIEGNPDPKHVSTSYAERQNLNFRMHYSSLYAAYERVLKRS